MKQERPTDPQTIRLVVSSGGTIEPVNGPGNFLLNTFDGPVDVDAGVRYLNSLGWRFVSALPTPDKGPYHTHEFFLTKG